MGYTPNALQELQALLRSGRGSRSTPSFGKPPYEDPYQENSFRSWYSTHADRWGLNPDPDDPLHQYDYRAAFEAGVGPSEEHDGHWPSEFKLASHPNRFVDGKDTITGEPVGPPKTSLDELRSLLQAPPKPKPNFYDLPAAKSMKAMGGIDPEDVDVEKANRAARESDPILRASQGALKGILDSPPGVFTRTALGVTTGLAGGAVRMANEVGKQAAPFLWPGQKFDPTKPDKIASAAQVLSAAAHSLQAEQERAPWMQRVLTDPVRFIVSTTGQSAPYMLGAAIPGVLPALTVGMMGQEEERLAAEGAKPGLGRLGAAAASGGVQALMERIPMARALQGFAGGAGKRALRAAAWEVPMESAQVLPATLADLSLGLREGESWGDILKKTGSEMLEAGVSAIAPSLLLGMGSPNQLHEPKSLLERSMDWVARRKAVVDLRNLPNEQAAQDQARIERRRVAAEAARQAGISAREAEEMLAPEVEEQEREYTDDEMLAYLDEQLAAEQQQGPPEPAAKPSWWKGGPATEIPAPKSPFRVNYGTRTEPEPQREPFAPAGDTVDGRKVRADIPNRSSIGASLGDAYTPLSGVREVRMDQFTLDESKASDITDERTLRLAAEIQESGEINPLIVGVDEQGPYILEGAHRYDALKALGAKSFPALVVYEHPETAKPDQAQQLEVLEQLIEAGVDPETAVEAVAATNKPVDRAIDMASAGSYSGGTMSTPTVEGGESRSPLTMMSRATTREQAERMLEPYKDVSAKPGSALAQARALAKSLPRGREKPEAAAPEAEAIDTVESGTKVTKQAGVTWLAVPTYKSGWGYNDKGVTVTVGRKPGRGVFYTVRDGNDEVLTTPSIEAAEEAASAARGRSRGTELVRAPGWARLAGRSARARGAAAGAAQSARQAASFRAEQEAQAAEPAPARDPVLEELDRHYEERKARESAVPAGRPAVGRSSASRAAQQAAQTRRNKKAMEADKPARDAALAEVIAKAAAAPVAQPAPAEEAEAVPAPNMASPLDKSERRTWWKNTPTDTLTIGKPQTRRTKRGEGGTDIRVEVPVTAPDGTRYVVTAHNDADQFKFHQPPKKGEPQWNVERHTTQPDGTVQNELLVTALSQREALGFVARGAKAMPDSGPAPVPAPAKPPPAKPRPAKGKPGEAGFLRNPFRRPLMNREQWAKWSRLWRPRKGLSRAMSGVERRWIARQAARKMEIEEGFKELTRAIEAHDYSQGGLKKSVPTTDPRTGVETVPVHPHQQLVRLLDDAFRGLVAVRGRYTESGKYIPSTLEKHAPETVAVMERLIAQRDTFQRELNKRKHAGGSGISDDISLELERHYGLYVHRTYQAKFDKGWQEKLEADHPVAFKAGMESWVRQALAPAIQKLQELNPDLSYDAARTQVMTAWDGRWAAQKIDPTTRRIKLPMVGKGKLDPATILLGMPVFTADGRKGTVEFFDPASPDTATVQVQQTPGQPAITEDHPVSDLRQEVRTSVVVDNPSQVEGSYLAALRWSNRGGSMLPGAAVEAGRNLNVRKERDRQKPDWERALLGEVRDIRANYLGTMAQMVHLAETDRFLHEIAEIGKAEGVFFPQPEGDATERVDPDLFGLGKVEGLEQAKIAEEILAGNPDLAPEVVTQLQAIKDSVKGGPAYHPRTSPLGQLFTTPEIAIALRNEVKGPQALGVRLAYGLASMAKANQTVYSIQSANRNYISNMFYLMANGWNPVSIFGVADRIGKGANARKIAYSRVVNDFYNLGQDAHLLDRATNDPHQVDKWLTDKLAEYIRLGIAHQSTTVGDLHRLARVAYDMKRNEDKPTKRKHLEQTAQDMYVAHDDYAKILAYERELATMKEAYPDLASLGMQPHQVAQAMQDLEREGALKQWRGLMMQGARQHYGEQMLLHRNLSDQAASKVRRTMQNYQELPELYQWLSGNPWTAPFTAFRFSLVRNAKNILQLGWEEALSQNQVIKKRGIQRLVGAGSTALFPMAWGKFLQWKSDTDDDEVDALRIIGYPWSANASLGIWSNKDGVITYFDGGHLDVWDDLREPFLASMRHGGWDDKFIRAGYALATNYLPFDEEIALGAALDLKRNRKKSGGEIWKDTDRTMYKILKGGMHLGKTAAFPGTLRSMQKLYYAAAGKDDPGGRDYQLMQEIIALGGPRFVTLNLKQRLDDHAKAYNHALRSAGDNLRVYRAEDIADGYEKAIDGTQRTVDDFLTQVRAYRTLGLTEDDIYTVLREASIRPAIAVSLSQLDRQTALLLLNTDLEVRQYKKQAELEGGY